MERERKNTPNGWQGAFGFVPTAHEEAKIKAAIESAAIWFYKNWGGKRSEQSQEKAKQKGYPYEKSPEVVTASTACEFLKCSLSQFRAKVKRALIDEVTVPGRVEVFYYVEDIRYIAREFDNGRRIKAEPKL